MADTCRSCPLLINPLLSLFQNCKSSCHIHFYSIHKSMTPLLLVLILSAARWTPSQSATAAASSSLVAWNGRVVFEGDSVAFDWEGVSASVTITSFSSLLVSISDRCAGSPIGGGSRWAVSMTPSDTKVSAAAHRIATFYSSSAVGTYVLFSNPSGGCDPYCSATNATTFTLTRITGADPPHPSPLTLTPHPSSSPLTLTPPPRLFHSYFLSRRHYGFHFTRFTTSLSRQSLDYQAARPLATSHSSLSQPTASSYRRRHQRPANWSL